MRTILALIAAILILSLAAQAETPEKEVRAVVTAFADGMRDRNVAHVQKTVGSDLMVIADGDRSDGWEQYRDRHLVREFSHPAPATHFEIVKLNASADIGWALAKTTISWPRRGDTVVWTTFVLERRGKEWKIVLVDRNPGRGPSGSANRARRR